MIDEFINMYMSVINPEDKTIVYDYRDISTDIIRTMLKINGRSLDITPQLIANIFELNMFEYYDPCVDLCICTTLDNTPKDCLDNWE